MPSQPSANARSEPSLILWDLVGSCNLKCPSCPMGSMRGVNAKGFIADDLFHAILAKLQREFSCRQLHFYNWTEPLLHPRIVEFCRAGAEAGFHVHLSSNLNHLDDADALLASGIKTLRISLSGFTQAVYRIGHRGGDVEKVKANMRTLAEATHERRNPTARVHVYYHKYRHNLHEIDAMQDFAASLGFAFHADWAFLMPLEKLLASQSGDLNDDERAFAEDSIVPSVEAALHLVQAHRQRPCTLIEQLVLDHKGQALLCCATFDNARNAIGDYLELDWRDLQQRRYRHATCDACTNAGAHVLYTSVSDPVLREQMGMLAARSLLEPPRPRRSLRLPIIGPSPRLVAESAP